jgi:hypothetical protein
LESQRSSYKRCIIKLLVCLSTVDCAAIRAVDGGLPRQKRRLRLACAACRDLVRPIVNTALFKTIDSGRLQQTIFEFRIDSNLNLVAVSREPASVSERPGLRMGHFPSGASQSLAF